MFMLDMPMVAYCPAFPVYTCMLQCHQKADSGDGLVKKRWIIVVVDMLGLFLTSVRLVLAILER